MSSLGYELPKEISRVRDNVLPEYLAIGSSGGFGALMIRDLLDRATNHLLQVMLLQCSGFMKN